MTGEFPAQRASNAENISICAGNSLVTREFPSQMPVMQSFDVFFDLRLNKRLCKQSRHWSFETPSRLFWRHRNDFSTTMNKAIIFCDVEAPVQVFSYTYEIGSVILSLPLKQTK